MAMAMAMAARTGRPGPAADEAWLDRLRQAADGEPASIEFDLCRSFQWQDRFLVGHAEIDADHRRFFAYFADAAAGGDGLSGTAATVALFLTVADDLQRHVAAEERILEAAGFTMLAEHRSSHRALIEQADAALTIGADGEWATALRLLAMAVLEHIVLEDAKLRPTLAAAACLHPPVAAPPSGVVAWPGL